MRRDQSFRLELPKNTEYLKVVERNQPVRTFLHVRDQFAHGLVAMGERLQNNDSRGNERPCHLLGTSDRRTLQRRRQEGEYRARFAARPSPASDGQVVPPRLSIDRHHPLSAQCTHFTRDGHERHHARCRLTHMTDHFRAGHGRNRERLHDGQRWRDFMNMRGPGHLVSRGMRNQ